MIEPSHRKVTSASTAIVVHGQRGRGKNLKHIAHHIYCPSLMVAINGWTDYFNVRRSQLKLRAGTEVILRVKPTQHSASEDFAALSLEERGCRFTHENKVGSSISQ